MVVTMRCMAVLLCAAAAVRASAITVFDDLITEEWHSFKMEHSKEYTSELEEDYRMKIFASNKLFIEKHNQRFQQGLESYELKTNQYADMLHHEFIHIMNGFNATAMVDMDQELESDEGPLTFIAAEHLELPAQMDWRTKGAVTEVKDQKQCGSCWAFGATGSLEGQYYRKTGRLVSLSEQNLVDCTRGFGNNGCGGGVPDYAFRYIQLNRGIDTERSYPYEARDANCRYNAKNRGATARGSVRVRRNDERSLLQAVGGAGPVVAALDASQRAFQFYSDGVYYDRGCSTNVNHAVLIVGYGKDRRGGDYWLVKNSWGTSWGKGGYIKMARNRNNHCGIAVQASYPLV